jgi:predicted MPP superfamily phosphohydrolase
VAVLVLLLFPSLQSAQVSKFLRNYLFAIFVALFFAKLLSAVFFAVDDIRRGSLWLMSKIFPSTGAHFVDDGNAISRSSFLTWLGVVVGGTLFSTFIYGFSNKYNYQLKRVKLSFNNLPEAFKGLKIVQISDIHSGSFQNKQAVNKGVDMLLKEKADLVLFTGDLVNDRAVEMENYIDVFNRVIAPMGVYSTLGNHDYGDYYWGVNPVGEKAIEKAKNLERLKQIHQEMGWRLLMNEHVALEKNGEQIALIGIENWGAKAGFPKYGRMDIAYSGADKYPFKILMSHDPSHWDAEVRVKYPDIDLTLSGHTHGMQFGVEVPGFKWSPVQWVYKEWAGLYEEAKQRLYVNRGYGFIGYPGRVGILPEITVFELV